jgi:transcriptional regulator with XRE-family HTH domain
MASDKLNAGGVNLDNKKIGDFILTLRKAKNMTQKELAEKLNITDKAVSKWERGLGYPDITIVSKLADILDVTVNELLNGERTVKESTICDIGDVVESTLDYADKVSEQRKFKTLNIAIGVISLIFLISIFICILCNLATTKTISWSIVPSCSIVLAWFIIMPIIRFKKNKWTISLLCLSILIIPFLWIIEKNTSINGWLNSIGIPIVIASLSYLWGVVYLFGYTKINKWYGVSIAFIIMPILDIIIDIVLGRLLIDYFFLLTMLGAVIISLTFFYIGFWRKNKKKSIKYIEVEEEDV